MLGRRHSRIQAGRALLRPDLSVSLWLVWGAPISTAAAALLSQVTGRPTELIPLHDLPAHLPARPAPATSLEM